MKINNLLTTKELSISKSIYRQWVYACMIACVLSFRNDCARDMRIQLLGTHCLTVLQHGASCTSDFQATQWIPTSTYSLSNSSVSGTHKHFVFMHDIGNLCMHKLHIEVQPYILCSKFCRLSTHEGQWVLTLVQDPTPILGWQCLHFFASCSGQLSSVLSLQWSTACKYVCHSCHVKEMWYTCRNGHLLFSYIYRGIMLDDSAVYHYNYHTLNCSRINYSEMLSFDLWTA